MKDTFSWEYEQSVMPPELLEIAFNFDRKLSLLWALDSQLPVEEMLISDLEWHFDFPFFWTAKKPFSLNPREVLNEPGNYKKHIERIMEVDASYPIYIIWWKDRWKIIDGLHRLCKLYLEGRSIIKVRKLPEEMIKLIQPE